MLGGVQDNKGRGAGRMRPGGRKGGVHGTNIFCPAFSESNVGLDGGRWSERLQASLYIGPGTWISIVLDCTAGVKPVYDLQQCFIMTLYDSKFPNIV